MPFRTVLSERPDDTADIDQREQISFRTDLDLGQLTACRTPGRDEDNPGSFFLASPHAASPVEREGLEIARQVIRALLGFGVRQVFGAEPEAPMAFSRANA
jgi:hypothetical protein